MKKKLLVMAASLVVAAVLAAGATLAYFTDKAEVTNQVITTGKVDIEVTGGTLALTNLVPGAPVAFGADLVVSLADGSNDAYIRIKPEIEIKRNGTDLAEDDEARIGVEKFFKDELKIGDGGYIELGDAKEFLKLGGTTKSKTIEFINATLPTDWGNIYTDISVNIKFDIEAIQFEYTDASDPFAGNTIEAYI